MSPNPLIFIMQEKQGLYHQLTSCLSKKDFQSEKSTITLQRSAVLFIYFLVINAWTAHTCLQMFKHENGQPLCLKGSQGRYKCTPTPTCMTFQWEVSNCCSNYQASFFFKHRRCLSLSPETTKQQSTFLFLSQCHTDSLCLLLMSTDLPRQSPKHDHVTGMWYRRTRQMSIC